MDFSSYFYLVGSLLENETGDRKYREIAQLSAVVGCVVVSGMSKGGEHVSMRYFAVFCVNLLPCLS
jgi:hypothetical protein